MRVLLFNQFFHPDPNPTAQLAADLALALTGAGHEVRVVASARPYSGRGLLPLVETWRGIEIRRVPGTALGRATRLARAVDYATFLGGALAPLLAGPRPDVVVALSTPPLGAALGAVAAERHGARLVYWVMDVYPDVAVALGALDPSTHAARALSTVARLLHRRADAIVAIDDEMKERLRAAGADPARIEVIDNWAGDDLFPIPREGSALRRRLGLGARFTVGYAGNFGWSHDFETVAAAAGRLGEDELHWLFIGDGPRRGGLERALAGRRNITFLPYVPRSELSDALACADASLVTIAAPLAGLVMPSKLYAILASGRPVVYVGPPAGRVHEAVLAGAGLDVRNGDTDALCAALRALAADEPVRVEMGRRARDVHDRRFHRARALAAHLAVIERVLDPATVGRRRCLPFS